MHNFAEIFQPMNVKTRLSQGVLSEMELLKNYFLQYYI